MSLITVNSRQQGEGRGQYYSLPVLDLTYLCFVTYSKGTKDVSAYRRSNRKTSNVSNWKESAMNRSVVVFLFPLL